MSPRPSLAEYRRPQILAAACRVIVDRGYDRARMTDIAAAAGVGTSVVQHYFHTRSELLSEAFWFANERSVEHWRLVSADGAQHPWRRLEALIENSIPDTPDWVEMYELWFELFRVSSRDAALREASLEGYDRWRDPMLQPINEGVTLGLFSPTLPAEDVADGVIGLCDGLMLQRLMSTDRMSIDRMRRILLAYLAQSLDYAPGPADRTSAARHTSAGVAGRLSVGA
jgi:AcrR family transcriptional regulator